MDLVTFLITTYNSEQWINECLNSILNQTHKNLQVLIIDDGSEDNTVDRIRQMPDKRIELYSKEHSGISKSLNYALDKIKGTYIARLGADDICTINRIEKQLEFLKKNKSYGIVGSNFILIDAGGKEIFKVKNPRKDEQIRDQMLRRYCVWDGSTLMKKEILMMVNGYDEDRTCSEDWDFFMRILNKTRFYNLQEYLSSKRIHKSNISSTPNAIRENKIVLLKYNNKLIGKDSTPAQKATGFFNIGYLYYYENDIYKAQNYFSKAFELNKSDLSIIKYYLFSKYLKKLILFVRRYKIYRFYDWLKHLDRQNIFFKGRW
ncbi:MAG: hypothetical protein BMS9Abin39_0500 [Ignavibacteria bacterium]|nr:MAG: hypothetical protein BMS9Abin39_0500 [Ignavibacteria bacterium]